MVNELSRAWRFIYDTLHANASLAALVNSQIHRGAVPYDGQLPAVIYALIAPGTDLMTLGGFRLWSEPLFKIVAAGETSDGLDLEPIADLIDTILHNADGTTDAGGRVFSCQRMRPFELIERSGNSVFQQLGGEYAITVRAS